MKSIHLPALIDSKERSHAPEVTSIVFINPRVDIFYYFRIEYGKPRFYKLVNESRITSTHLISLGILGFLNSNAKA